MRKLVKENTELRDRLADDLDLVRVQVDERIVRDMYGEDPADDPECRAYAQAAQALRAGRPATVDAEALSWSLQHLGLLEEARRIGRIGGDWTVAPDGTYDGPVVRS